ncbi:MAG: hypothetical protein ACRCW1_06095 [Anaerotignaceae bacterium]
MAIIGMVFILLAISSLLAITVTYRRQWLIILLWCFPIVGMAYFTPKTAEINGLLVVISLLMIMHIAYSLWNIKLWHIIDRKKNKFFYAFVFLFNFIITIYYVWQCILNGYVGFLYTSKSKEIDMLITVLVAAIITILMCPVAVTAFDKYFSKNETFVMLKCKAVGGKKENAVYGFKKYAIIGIQNGKEYTFRTTRKAYFLLKKQEILVMEAKRGVFGGVYVYGNVYENKGRRNARINKVLIEKCVFLLLIIAVVTLFILRIRLGISFDDIFIIIKEVFSRGKN